MRLKQIDADVSKQREAGRQAASAASLAAIAAVVNTRPCASVVILTNELVDKAVPVFFNVNAKLVVPEPVTSPVTVID